MAEYRPNPSLEIELMHDPGFVSFVTGKALDVKKEVARFVPGGNRARPFIRKLYVNTPVPEGHSLVAEVGTEFKLGHIFEFGSPTSPAYAPLRKAASAAGLELR